MANDLLNDAIHSDVAEALRRLPQEIIDQRNFRLVRAQQLSACHRILPKEQWTKYEEVSKYQLTDQYCNSSKIFLAKRRIFFYRM